ncbi:MAG: thioredoxin family protein [Kiritimatiellae bacterium]|nr:thioredoxin family protein [Kiritimatiellia bacterium]
MTTLRAPWRFFGLAALLCASAAVAASPFSARIAEPAPRQPDQSLPFEITVSVPEHHVVYKSSVEVKAETGAALGAVKLPAAVTKPDPVDPDTTVEVFKGDFTVTGTLKPGSDAATPKLTISFQGCSETECFMPEDHTFVCRNGKWSADNGETAAAATDADSGFDWTGGRTPATAGGFLGENDLLDFLDRAAGKTDGQTGGLKGFLADPTRFFRSYGLGLTLLLVLLGGVLLNLTPCVLPMMPITLAIIGAGSAAGGKKRGFLFGGAYGMGMALAYGGIGWIILRGGFFVGSFQSSPVFNIAVAALFLVFALAMFDVFTLDFSRLFKRGKRGRGGIWAAMLAGAFSAVLAGACIAPVVLAVLVLAGALISEGHPAAQLLPFALGVGMALPWPFAGAGLSVLPKPGAWMVRVKQAFGVLLVLLAAYYAFTAVKTLRHSAPADGESADASVIRIDAGDREAWAAALEKAKAESKPVFADFWASWCKNCLAMEKTTFRNPAVKERLSGYVVIKVRAENPDEPAAKAMLDAFAIRGLPAFVVLE